jgi:RHS repeat-associated protein
VYQIHPDNAGGLYYEKEQKEDGSIEHRHYVGGSILITSVGSAPSTITATKYWHKDHLGSNVAITNAAGVVIERMAYDPFGKRRTTGGAYDQNGTLRGANTDRGFTGHEHLDDLGFIHMNGRIFDPTLGRFLSADPYIQYADNLQSYNRYSYLMNNPLNATDPTGYFKLKKALKIVAVVAIAAFTYGAVSAAIMNSFSVTLANAQLASMTTSALAAVTPIAGGSAITVGMVAGAGAAAASGFVSTFVATGGDFNASLRAGLAGAVTGGVAGAFGSQYSLARVGSEALAGGVASSIMGGGFQDGFKRAMGMSLLTYGNYLMRQDTKANSMLAVDKATGEYVNVGGDSVGFLGDGEKFAGARREWDSLLNSWKPCDAPMGGCQGIPRIGDVRARFGPINYSSGSVFDRINEAFSGPHDFFRKLTGAYDQYGNSVTATSTFGRIMDNYVMNFGNLIPAAPSAVGGFVHYYSPTLIHLHGAR